MTMHMNNKRWLLFFLINALAISVRAGDKPVLREGRQTHLEIVRVNPSKGDLQKINQRHKGAAQAVIAGQVEEVHVVKLYVDMPAPSGKAYPLYIGENKIEQYGGFQEGIFFKAYERKDLDAWADQPIRFAVGGQLSELGIKFPSREEIAALPGADPAGLPEL